MKPWLKGGITGLIVLMAITGLIVLGLYVTPKDHTVFLTPLILLEIFLPFGASTFMYLIPNGILYFIIGALVGFIIGKIKSKKQ